MYFRRGRKESENKKFFNCLLYVICIHQFLSLRSVYGGERREGSFGTKPPKTRPKHRSQGHKPNDRGPGTTESDPVAGTYSDPLLPDPTKQVGGNRPSSPTGFGSPKGKVVRDFHRVSLPLRLRSPTCHYTRPGLVFRFVLTTYRPVH